MNRGDSDEPLVSLIFLDIDGVMNSQKSRKMKFDSKEGRLKMDDFPAPLMLENLQLITSRTGCEIVLSSTWRLLPPKAAQLKACFEELGLKMIGTTPDLQDCGRGDRVDEILQWLEEAGDGVPEAWVAIDDMDLVRMNDRLEDKHFVKTNDAVGLTEEKAAEAIDKLLGQLSVGS